MHAQQMCYENIQFYRFAERWENGYYVNQEAVLLGSYTVPTHTVIIHTR